MTENRDFSSLDAIDHIAIQVLDIGKAIAWYKEHFKCTVEYQDQSWGYIKFANIHLALVLASQHPQHLAFNVENASDYGTLKTHRDGTKSVYVCDPAGNTIEFVDKLSVKTKR